MYWWPDMHINSWITTNIYIRCAARCLSVVGGDFDVFVCFCCEIYLFLSQWVIVRIFFHLSMLSIKLQSFACKHRCVCIVFCSALMLLFFFVLVSVHEEHKHTQGSVRSASMKIQLECYMVICWWAYEDMNRIRMREYRILRETKIANSNKTKL